MNENAASYFEKSKKFKGKIEGINETVSKYEKEKEILSNKERAFLEEEESKNILKSRKKEWYEKFRWFFTSKKHLCIGGRDAGSNEVIIKKHLDKNDLVFHTDMAGSPFFVIKLNEDQATDEEIEEVATATACYSRAWKKGIGNAEVFYVKPEQVTKEANTGEYLSKGSFVIRGKTNYTRHKMELGITVKEGVVIAGPVSSLKEYIKIETIVQGDEKPSDIAKKLKKSFEDGLLDDFIKSLPPGSCKLKKK